MDAIRIGWRRGFDFHARTLDILIMADLFFATYDELVLLTWSKAWKMHDALIKVAVHMLIELASNPARYMGGKLAIGCHPDTCPISKPGTYT